MTPAPHPVSAARTTILCQHPRPRLDDHMCPRSGSAQQPDQNTFTDNIACMTDKLISSPIPPYRENGTSATICATHCTRPKVSTVSMASCRAVCDDSTQVLFSDSSTNSIEERRKSPHTVSKIAGSTQLRRVSKITASVGIQHTVCSINQSSHLLVLSGP